MVYRRTYSRSRARRGGVVRSRRSGWIRNYGAAGATAPAPGFGSIDLLPLSVDNAGLETGMVDAGSVVGSTVMRIRGNFAWNFATTVGFSTNRILIGITVCPRSVTPDPQSPSSWQWLHWQMLDPTSLSVGIFGVGSPTTSYAVGTELDVKAKRIIQSPGDTLKLAFSSFASTETNVDWHWSASVLMRYA